MQIYLAGHDTAVEMKELRADVADAIARGRGGLPVFTPETVDGLLDLIEEQANALARGQELNLARSTVG